MALHDLKIGLKLPLKELEMKSETASNRTCTFIWYYIVASNSLMAFPTSPLKSSSPAGSFGAGRTTTIEAVIFFSLKRLRG